MKPSIYLAGPISGGSYEGVTGWRNIVQTQLEEAGITVYTPMRGKQHLLQELTIADAYDASVLSNQRAIMRRDFFDVQRSDAILVNFLPSDRVSIGTVMEIAWAYQAHKPIIAIQDDTGNLHEHAMLREAYAYRVKTLDEAVMVAKTVLLP